MTKKLLLLLVCIMTAIGGFAQATSGNCGENLTWNFDSSTGTLTISGTGDMTDYGTSGEIPWVDFRAQIMDVVMGDGITSISKWAFADCYKIPSIVIPSGVITVGSHAFLGCNHLETVTIPESVTELGSKAFEYCNSLEAVNVAWDRPIAITWEVFPLLPLVNIALTVPAGTKAFYLAAEIWKEFKIVDPAAAIENIQVPNISIYPNPVLESFCIGNITEPAVVTVSDVTGKPVLQQTVIPEETVVVSHLQNGIYFVNVKGRTTKIVKQ